MFSLSIDEPLPENEIAPKKTADKLKEGGQEKNSDGEKNPKETGDGGDIETGIEVRLWCPIFVNKCI